MFIPNLIITQWVWFCQSLNNYIWKKAPIIGGQHRHMHTLPFAVIGIDLRFLLICRRTSPKALLTCKKQLGILAFAH